MATAATTAHMTTFLTSVGVTTPTVDGNADTNSYAYEVITHLYQLLTDGLDAILTDGEGGVLVDDDGNVLCDSL